MGKIPPGIRKAMDAQGIENVRRLAIKCGYGDTPMSIHRVLKGGYKHRSLIAYKKVSNALDWTLDQFFFIAQGNDPEVVGNFIRARLKQLDKTIYQFEKEVSKSGEQGGWHDYISGGITYNRLQIYNRLKTGLGITADTLYECLVMDNCLTEAERIDTLTPVAKNSNLMQVA